MQLLGPAVLLTSKSLPLSPASLSLQGCHICFDLCKLPQNRYHPLLSKCCTLQDNCNLYVEDAIIYLKKNYTIL